MPPALAPASGLHRGTVGPASQPQRCRGLAGRGRGRRLPLGNCTLWWQQGEGAGTQTKGSRVPRPGTPHTPSSAALGRSSMDATQFPRASECNPPGGRWPAPALLLRPPAPPLCAGSLDVTWATAIRLSLSEKPALPGPRLPPHRGSRQQMVTVMLRGDARRPSPCPVRAASPRPPVSPRTGCNVGHGCPFRGPDCGWLCNVGRPVHPPPVLRARLTRPLSEGGMEGTQQKGAEAGGRCCLDLILTPVVWMPGLLPAPPAPPTHTGFHTPSDAAQCTDSFLSTAPRGPSPSSGTPGAACGGGPCPRHPPTPVGTNRVCHASAP